MRAAVAKKPDSTITRRELREATGLPDHRVAALLSELVQLEYAEVLCGSQGQRFRYRLTSSNGASSPALAGLATADELRVRLAGTAATSKLRKRG